MKLYSLPEELMETIPEIDYSVGNYHDWTRQEDEHRESIRDWLKKAGYTGKNTGKVLKEQIADGYAEYMLVEGAVGSGTRSFLVHLPYADGYHDPNVEFLPKKEVMKRIKARETAFHLFGS